MNRRILLTLTLAITSLAALALAGCSTTPRPSGGETDQYPYYTEIQSKRTEALTLKLEEGEEFGGHLWVWKWDRLGFMQPQAWRIPQAMTFSIEGPAGDTVLDAVRIEYEYEFTITAPSTGEYTLVFDDSEGYCVVRMTHNSPKTLGEIIAP